MGTRPDLVWVSLKSSSLAAKVALLLAQVPMEAVESPVCKTVGLSLDRSTF